MSTNPPDDIRPKCQNFLVRLHQEPNPNDLEPTPDGRAKTLAISHVEMTLDELFFGLWSTENFTSQVISNEVVGSLELVVTHPVTGTQLRRTGAASIIIQVDRAPEGVTGSEKNRWANNPDNKKPNALDLGYPKLKAECLKNAAQSFGKIFGRDVNRRTADVYKPILPPTQAALPAKSETESDLFETIVQNTLNEIAVVKTTGALDHFVEDLAANVKQDQRVVNAIDDKKAALVRATNNGKPKEAATT